MLIETNALSLRQIAMKLYEDDDDLDVEELR